MCIKSSMGPSTHCLYLSFFTKGFIILLTLILISSVKDRQKSTDTVNTNHKELYEKCMYSIRVIFLFLLIYVLYIDTSIGSD